MRTISSAESELAGGKKLQRALIHSLVQIAHEMEHNPDLKDVKAVGGVTILLYSGSHSREARLMPRLGFTVMPYSSPLGRFGEFWENVYSWLLIWVYNPQTLRSRSLTNLRRAEFWAPADEFRKRYLGQPSVERSL